MIRRATTDDAAAIAVVHVRSWQSAYRGLIAQDFLDALDPEQRVPRWAEWLTAADWPRRGTLVAEVDSSVVGFANLVPTRDPDLDGAAEITAIYLLPTHWGIGLGRTLMADSLTSLAQAGYTEATLWVLDTNTRARHFYEAAGWHPDGTTKLDTQLGLPLHELRYRHPL